MSKKLSTIGIAAAGVVAGVVLAGTMAAQAASPSPAATSGPSSANAEDPHPGDNGADGVPEDQEHHGGHGGHGGGLDLSGTVTEVGTDSVTIKTASGTTKYAVTSSSDIDKNGEGKLSDLVAGDAVRFSTEEAASNQIDKLHAGDEGKNMPQGDGAGDSDATSPAPAASSSAASGA